uniref:HTH_38 domain-containing protein n=1 Tax=Heterorhabditis bacteriophora TaxID=37862 RepID=A0A1I7XL20_HETBA
MGHASTLSLHERGQIKALSTAGYTVKRSADVLTDREKRTILRTASNRTTSIVGIRRTCGIDASKTTTLASLFNEIMAPSTPVEAPTSGWRIMTWPLWTGPRNLIPIENLGAVFLRRIYDDNRQF